MTPDDYAPLLSTDAFFEIDFGGRIKAELEKGVIRPSVRGPAARVVIADNVLACIAPHLRGTGKVAYGSSLALRSGPRSVRYPDVVVYADDDAGGCDRLWLDDPLVVVHVVPTQRFRHDRLIDEYRALASIRTIVLIDFETHAMRVDDRVGPASWHDTLFATPTDLVIPSLGLTIPHAEIFARD